MSTSKFDGIPDPVTNPETPAQFAKRVGVSNSTVMAWIKTGLALGGGRVKLRAIRIGWKWKISTEAWEQFVRDCNPEWKPLPESPAMGFVTELVILDVSPDSRRQESK